MFVLHTQMSSCHVCRGVSPQGVQAEPRSHAIWLPHLSSKHTKNSMIVSPHGRSNEGTLTSPILIVNHTRFNIFVHNRYVAVLISPN